MKKYYKMAFLAIFFFVLLPSRVFALDAVLFNENILSQKVSNEINLIGKELYQKSNIFIGVMVGDKTEIETLLNKQKNFLNLIYCFFCQKILTKLI